MKHTFLISLFFLFVFGPLIVVGLRGILFKRPFLISFRFWSWFFVIGFILLFFDIFFEIFSVLPNFSKRLAELDLIGWVSLLGPIFLFVPCLVITWVSSQGYTVCGATNNSLHDALLVALKAKNIQFQEDFSIIKIPATSTEIQISFWNWLGGGFIQVKSNKDTKLLHELAVHMNQYFRENMVEINVRYFWYQFLSGIFLLLMIVLPSSLFTSGWVERAKELAKLGYEKQYYSTGELQYEFFYDSNLKQKQTKEYYQSGQLKLEWLYENGVLKQSKEYNENGTLKGEWFYKDEKVIRAPLK